MATTKISAALSRLGRPIPSIGPETLDYDLLSLFANCRDESAFEELVRRHGPMVLGVCRRIIGDRHLAEDAFQATFVVLAAKAGSIRPISAISGWLYGVAYRTALRARTMSDRRRRRETLVESLPDTSGRTEEPVEIPPNAIAALEHEIANLPHHYRTAVVLCELQGVSRKDAAAQLGVAEGTVSSRLAAARHKLAIRLRRRGVALPAAGLLVALAQMTAASVPPSLTTRTVAVAISSAHIPACVAILSNGVLRLMLVQKLSTFTKYLVLSLAGILACARLSLGTQAAPNQPIAQPVAVVTDTPTPLTQPAPKAVEPAQVIKSQNKLIIYRAGRLNLIDPDGKNELTVAEDGDKFYHGPVKLSPDGKRIAYLVHIEKIVVPEPGNHLPARHLYVKALDEKGPGTDLGGFRCKGYDFAWSPNGSQIAVSEETAQNIIDNKTGRKTHSKETAHFIIDIKTKEKTTLDLPKDHFITDWSRDGKYFLTTELVGVFSPDSIPDARLYLMNRDGTEHKALTGPKQFNGFGRLSPDGNSVLYFGLTLPAAIEQGEWRLHILDLKTGKSSTVENFPDKWQLQGEGICWSPDSRRIAYTWREVADAKKETKSHLVICDLDGKNAKTIASEKDQNAFIASIGAIDWR